MIKNKQQNQNPFFYLKSLFFLPLKAYIPVLLPKILHFQVLRSNYKKTSDTVQAYTLNCIRREYCYNILISQSYQTHNKEPEL